MLMIKLLQQIIILEESSALHEHTAIIISSEQVDINSMTLYNLVKRQPKRKKNIGTLLRHCYCQAALV